VFPFYKAADIMNLMVRILLVLFFIIIFTLFLGHFTPAKSQGKGTLVVTTTPVSGDIYVDFFLKNTKFWSGNLDTETHAVSLGDVDGYITQPPQMVTVIANQTYYVIGAYRKLSSLLKSVYIMP
jgi:hypothetical protein